MLCHACRTNAERMHARLPLKSYIISTNMAKASRAGHYVPAMRLISKPGPTVLYTPNCAEQEPICCWSRIAALVSYTCERFNRANRLHPAACKHCRGAVLVAVRRRCQHQVPATYRIRLQSSINAHAGVSTPAHRPEPRARVLR